MSSTSFISLPAAARGDTPQLQGGKEGEEVETGAIDEASAIGTTSNSSAPTAFSISTSPSARYVQNRNNQPSRRRRQANLSWAGFRFCDHITLQAHPPPLEVLQQVPKCTIRLVSSTAPTVCDVSYHHNDVGDSASASAPTGPTTSES